MATPFVGFLYCWWWPLLSFTAPLPGCCGAPVELCLGLCLLMFLFCCSRATGDLNVLSLGVCFAVRASYVVREKWYASERVCCYINLQYVLPSCLFWCWCSVVSLLCMNLISVVGLRGLECSCSILHIAKYCSSREKRFEAFCSVIFILYLRNRLIA